MISSAHIWKQHSDILFSGLYENQEDRQTIRVIEKNGIRFSLLAYTFGVNETTNYKSIQKQLKRILIILGQLDKEQIKEECNNAKAQSDVVIVAVHWVKKDIVNYLIYKQRICSFILLDLGVDVVNWKSSSFNST